ncbi:hypothetical protein NQ318_014495 [Aromia moschata]|uniref:Calphotin-like n=1 Tax=Aromia moschata TaxID=1265417 RepID=A0AAV8YNX6_9CUCU|nr:hypothetical protein NQ318_014495 [Aromia moschata]
MIALLIELVDLIELRLRVLLLAFSGYVVTAKAPWTNYQCIQEWGDFTKDQRPFTAQAEGGEILTQPAAEAAVVAEQLTVSVPEVAFAPAAVTAQTVQTVAAGIAPAAGVVQADTVVPGTAEIVQSEPLPVATAAVAPAAGIVQADAIPSVAVAPAVVSGAAEFVQAVPAIAAVSAIPVEHTVEIIQPDPHIIETEIVDAPVIKPQQSTDLVGPSGSISTRGSSSCGIWASLNYNIGHYMREPAKVLVATPIVAAVPVIASIKIPLRAVPVVEVVSDVPAPTTSFVLEPKVSAVTVGPSINTASITPQVTLSTLSPLTAGQIGSHTVAAPISLSTPAPNTLSSTPASIILQSPESSQSLGVGATIHQPVATIESAGSYGVIPNAGGAVPISSTLRPEVVPAASTIAPLLSAQEDLGIPENFRSNLNYALANNRQLSINPSLISPANIIPPEIGGFSKSAVDIGTVTISSTASPIPSEETSNLQHVSAEAIVDNNLRNIDGRLGQVQAVPGQNQGIPIAEEASQPVTVAGNVPIGHPLPAVIPQDGLVGSRLAKYGIDAKEIHLAQVPLSSATRLAPNSPLPSSLDQEIDHTASSLWNRYGRGVKKEEDLNDKNNKKKD